MFYDFTFMFVSGSMLIFSIKFISKILLAQVLSSFSLIRTIAPSGHLHTFDFHQQRVEKVVSIFAINLSSTIRKWGISLKSTVFLF